MNNVRLHLGGSSSRSSRKEKESRAIQNEIIPVGLDWGNSSSGEPVQEGGVWSACFGLKPGSSGMSGQLLKDPIVGQQALTGGPKHRRVSSLSRFFSSLTTLQDSGEREPFQKGADDLDGILDDHGVYLAKLTDDLLGLGDEASSAVTIKKEAEEETFKSKITHDVPHSAKGNAASDHSFNRASVQYTSDAKKNDANSKQKKEKNLRVFGSKSSKEGAKLANSFNLDRKSSDSPRYGTSVGGSPRALIGNEDMSDRETMSMSMSSESAYSNGLNRLSVSSVASGSSPGGYKNFWKSITKGRRAGNNSTEKKGHEFSADKVKRLVISLKSRKAMQSSSELNAALMKMDSRALAALLKELSKAGASDQSARLFDHIRSQPKGSHVAELADLYTYTTAISQCGAQMLHKALELMTEMRGKGIQCNIHTYSALMGVCVKNNESNLALEIYEQLIEDGCQPNLVTYNILIDALNKTGRLDVAISTLDQIKGSNLIAEARTYNSIISYCGKACNGELAMTVYKKMLEDGVSPTTTTFTSLISACGRSGMVEEAMDLYRSMESMGCEPNVITFSSLISVCERAGEEELALKLFRDMKAIGVQPNIVTYNSILGTLAKCTNWKGCLDIFQEMVGRCCQHDSATYSAIIVGLSRGRQWKKALEFYDKSVVLGLRIESGALMALVGCLWSCGRLAAQRRALKMLSDLQNDGTIKLHFNSNMESSIVADTAAGCCLAMIKWLTDFRLGLAGATAYHQPIRTLTFTNGKFCPVDNGGENINSALIEIIEAYMIPASVSTIKKGHMVQVDARMMPSWSSAGGGYLLLGAVDLESGPHQNISSLLKDDSNVFAQCQKAFAAVRNFEKSVFGEQEHASLSISPTTLRQQIIENIISFAGNLRMREEISHDAVQLCDRLLSLGSASMQPPAPVCAAGLLLLACRQSNCAQLLLKNGQDILQSAGLPMAVVLEAEQWIMGTLGSNCAAISPLRVLNLYFERLGYDMNAMQKYHFVNVLVMTASDMVARAAIHPAFSSFPPSITAGACLTLSFSKLGFYPGWPTAVEDLTEYKISDPNFDQCVRMMKILMNPAANSVDDQQI